MRFDKRVDLVISSAAVYRFKLPLNYALPLKGASLVNREGLVLEFKTDQGLYHYGEASPLVNFSRESLEEAQFEIIRVAGHLLTGQKITEPLSASVAFAISSALDSEQPNSAESTLLVAPLLVGSQSDILQRLKSWKGGWPKEFKLKVGRYSVDLDISATLEILKVLPSSVKLRLDANQQWSFDQAMTYARSIPVARISYIEEPVSSGYCNEAFYQATGLGYALDETLQSSKYDYKREAGLKALIIKPTFVGELDRYKSWLARAKEDRVRVIFSSAFESHLGVDMIRCLARRYAPNELHGFDTLSAFAQPLCSGLPDQGQRLSRKILDSMEQVWCCSKSREISR